MTQELAIATIPANATALALPDGMPYAEWRALGDDIMQRQRNTLWLAADWFLYGQTHFAEQLKLDLPEITDDPKLLRKAAAVAQAFGADNRSPALSYQHYAHVADMPAGEADALLAQAKAERWPAKRLRIVAMERKTALGQITVFSDDDYAYHALQDLARRWNRATAETRQEFLDMVEEANGGIVDV